MPFKLKIKKITVPTPGTAVPLFSTPKTVKKVLIQALDNNFSINLWKFRITIYLAIEYIKFKGLYTSFNF